MKTAWICIGLIIAAGTVLLLPRLQQTDPVPEELRGRWITTESAYADRFFEIETEKITFGTGGNDFNTYSITNVNVESHEDLRLYTLHFKDASGAKMKRSVYYSVTDGGQIWFKNQEGTIWVLTTSEEE